jgi:hypothetical protein
MLGLTGIVVPAHASFSFYNGTTGNAQYNNAVTLAGWTNSSLETFGGSSGSLNGSSEYDDTATLVKFFAFLSNGTTTDTFTVSGTTLRQHTGGDVLKITLPANVFAFEFTTTFTGTTIADLCIEPGVSSFTSTCAANQEVVFGPAPNEFIGITSDTAFNTIFIGPSINGNGQAALQLINFSDATGLGASTPEPGSMALLGFGLLSAGLLRRRLRALASVRSGQC